MSLSANALSRRQTWLRRLAAYSGTPGQKARRLEDDLESEVAAEGVGAIRDHLHLCGAIPETFGASSSEEKLYSKYTDAVVAVALRAIGLKARVLTTRSNSADVEAEAPTYDLVADAKVFRLSRTAKNPKDFKVEAMAGWKGRRKYALVVCPVYQLPSGKSQIYEKAVARGVTILTYSHLAALVALADAVGRPQAMAALSAAIQAPEKLQPSQSATAYLRALNVALIASDPIMGGLLQREHSVNHAGLNALKAQEAAPLQAERATIMAMNLETAQAALLKHRGIDSRLNGISGVADRGLLAIT